MKRGRQRTSFQTLGARLRQFGQNLRRSYTTLSSDSAASSSNEPPPPAWHQNTQTPLIWREAPDGQPVQRADADIDETPFEGFSEDAPRRAPTRRGQQPPAAPQSATSQQSTPPLQRRSQQQPQSKQTKQQVDDDIALSRIMEFHRRRHAERDRVRQERTASLADIQAQANEGEGEIALKRQRRMGVDYIEMSSLRGDNPEAAQDTKTDTPAPDVAQSDKGPTPDPSADQQNPPQASMPSANSPSLQRQTDSSSQASANPPASPVLSSTPDAAPQMTEETPDWEADLNDDVLADDHDDSYEMDFPPSSSSQLQRRPDASSDTARVQRKPAQHPPDANDFDDPPSPHATYEAHDAYEVMDGEDNADDFGDGFGDDFGDAPYEQPSSDSPINIDRPQSRSAGDAVQRRPDSQQTNVPQSGNVDSQSTFDPVFDNSHDDHFEGDSPSYYATDDMSSPVRRRVDPTQPFTADSDSGDDDFYDDNTAYDDAPPPANITDTPSRTTAAPLQRRPVEPHAKTPDSFVEYGDSDGDTDLADFDSGNEIAAHASPQAGIIQRSPAPDVPDPTLQRGFSEHQDDDESFFDDGADNDADFPDNTATMSSPSQVQRQSYDVDDEESYSEYSDYDEGGWSDAPPEAATRQDQVQRQSYDVDDEESYSDYDEGGWSDAPPEAAARQDQVQRQSYDVAADDGDAEEAFYDEWADSVDDVNTPDMPAASSASPAALTNIGDSPRTNQVQRQSYDANDFSTYDTAETDDAGDMDAASSSMASDAIHRRSYEDFQTEAYDDEEAWVAPDSGDDGSYYPPADMISPSASSTDPTIQRSSLQQHDDDQQEASDSEWVQSSASLPSQTDPVQRMPNAADTHVWDAADDQSVSDWQAPDAADFRRPPPQNSPIRDLQRSRFSEDDDIGDEMWLQNPDETSLDEYSHSAAHMDSGDGGDVPPHISRQGLADNAAAESFESETDGDFDSQTPGTAPLQRQIDDDNEIITGDGDMDLYQAMVMAGVISPAPSSDHSSRSSTHNTHDVNRRYDSDQQASSGSDSSDDREHYVFSRTVDDTIARANTAPQDNAADDNAADNNEGDAGVNMDKLARDVYKVLKKRLRNERERRDR